MKGTWRVITALLVFWLIILVYMSSTFFSPNDLNERTERQLVKALQELDALKNQNEELQALANELKDIRLAAGNGNFAQVNKLKKRLELANRELKKLTENGSHRSDLPNSDGNAGAKIVYVKEPSGEHERLRRKIANGVREQWYYLRTELNKIKRLARGNAQVESAVKMAFDNGAEQERSVLEDLRQFADVDGTDEWRKKEHAELQDLVQRRLHYLQNPKNCNKAKKLVCNLNKGCGYGCQLHHVVYCFMIAYGTERTMILESRGWRYSSGGWDKVFKPVSDTCRTRPGGSSRSWGALDAIKDVQTIDLPIVDSLHPRPPFMPLSIPEDLAPRLTRLHGNPAVWWVAQFVKYLIKPQPALAKDMQETQQAMGFINPIVGVHVRRTDKVGTEAAYHPIEEYMAYVDEWYRLYERNNSVEVRRVYLATDEPSLLAEAKKKFPEYRFISDTQISKSAGLGSRYSDASLRGIILDIHFLSLSNYLVCTFSSQVCRVAYEIMQTLHPDASSYYHSLDDIYYYGGQNAHNQRAIYPHNSQKGGDMDIRTGDVVGIAGNHWDGYSKGLNRRTGQNGLYPSYKVEEIVEIVKYPTYPQVPLKVSKLDQEKKGS